MSNDSMVGLALEQPSGSELMSIAQKVHCEGNVTVACAGDGQWKVASRDGTLSAIVTDVQITTIVYLAADVMSKEGK